MIISRRSYFHHPYAGHGSRAEGRRLQRQEIDQKTNHLVRPELPHAERTVGRNALRDHSSGRCGHDERTEQLARIRNLVETIERPNQNLQISH